MTDVHYLGWSGFLLDDGDVRIAIDPHWSSWRTTGALPSYDLTPLTGIVLSHGHPDHVADVPSLLRLHPKAWVLGDPKVAAWARSKVPEAADRIFMASPNERVERDGATIVLHPGVHVGDSGLAQLRKLLSYARRSPVATARLLRATKDAPGTAGVYTVELILPSGTRVVHAAETVHRDAPWDAIEAARDDADVDVFLLGVEPGEEDACRAELHRRGSSRTLVFSPHAETRRVFGDDRPIAWDRVLGPGVEQARPTTDVAP